MCAALFHRLNISHAPMPRAAQSSPAPPPLHQRLSPSSTRQRCCASASTSAMPLSPEQPNSTASTSTPLTFKHSTAVLLRRPHSSHAPKPPATQDKRAPSHPHYYLGVALLHRLYSNPSRLQSLDSAAVPPPPHRPRPCAPCNPLTSISCVQCCATASMATATPLTFNDLGAVLLRQLHIGDVSE